MFEIPETRKLDSKNNDVVKEIEAEKVGYIGGIKIYARKWKSRNITAKFYKNAYIPMTSVCGNFDTLTEAYLSAASTAIERFPAHC